MYNYFMLIGKLKTDTSEEMDDYIKVEARKDSSQETDEIPIYVDLPFKDFLKNNFKKGDVIAVKGRIQASGFEETKLVCERIIRF